MARIHLATDIKPVTEFRAHAAELLQQVRATGRPVILTQRGHSAAVLMAVEQYEQLTDELELLRDVRTAEEQLSRGEGLSNAAAKSQVLKALPK